MSTANIVHGSEIVKPAILPGLEVFDLYEPILDRIPNRNLAILQRVNTTWRDAIKSYFEEKCSQLQKHGCPLVLSTDWFAKQEEKKAEEVVKKLLEQITKAKTQTEWMIQTTRV